MSHSPEPWEYNRHRVHSGIVAVNNNFVCRPDLRFSTHEDMERIVACVNACAGIPTEELIGKKASKIIAVVDAYLDGNSVMLETVEAIVLCDKEVPDHYTIEAKILDPEPRDKPRGDDDLTAFIQTS